MESSGLPDSSSIPRVARMVTAAIGVMPPTRESARLELLLSARWGTATKTGHHPTRPSGFVVPVLVPPLGYGVCVYIEKHNFATGELAPGQRLAI